MIEASPSPSPPPAPRAWTEFNLEPLSAAGPPATPRADPAPAPHPLAPGTEFGHWELVRRLGRGGMGEVFEAFYRPARRRYALKILSREHHDDSVAVKRFDHEFWALTRVEHPAIVAPFFAGEEQGVRFYAMELLRGESLDRVLGRGALGPVRAAVVGIQAAGALAAMHAVGIVHRDLKPGNVLLLAGEGDRVKLLDTGIAKLLPKFYEDVECRTPPEKRLRTLPGALLGTPGYMAPEAVLGAEASPAQDIYGLAVTIFRLATGLLPYHELIPPGPGDEPRRSADLGWPIPRALEEVLRRALSVDPAIRQASMEELRRQLEGAVEEIEAEAAEERGAAAAGDRGGGGIGLGAAQADEPGESAVSSEISEEGEGAAEGEDAAPTALEVAEDGEQGRREDADDPAELSASVPRQEPIVDDPVSGIREVDERPRPTSDPDSEGRIGGPERGETDPLASSAEADDHRSRPIEDRPRWSRLAALVAAAILCIAAGDLLGRARTQGGGVEASIRWARGVDHAARSITPEGATEVVPSIAASPSPSDEDAISTGAWDRGAPPPTPPEMPTGSVTEIDDRPTEAPAPAPRRTLAAAAFRKVVSPHRAALERCTRGIPEAPELAAEVRVSAGGSVEGVRLTPAVSFIAEQCVTEILGGLRFPQAETASTHAWRLIRPN